MATSPTASPLFRPKDASRLDALHPLLRQVVMKCATNGGRFIVIETARAKAAQMQAYRTGHSRARWGQSPHDYSPALAVDLGPSNYPGQLGDYHNLALAMFAAAKECKVAIIWGGDWHSLKDWPHFELADWKRIARAEKLNP